MSYVESYHTSTFQDHTLVVELDTPAVKVFRLKAPGKSRLQGCQIVFTSEGIVILGDLTPARNGCISRGYGLLWFAGNHSEDYLCEKFLTKIYRSDLAKEMFKRELLSFRRQSQINPSIEACRRFHDISKSAARDAWEWISTFDTFSGLPNEQEFFDRYAETFTESPEGCYGYDLGEAGWLCIIQQTFSRLYAKLLKEKGFILSEPVV